MPPHKPNRYEIELQKNLENAQGELDRVLEERNQFGEKIASLTEQVATLQAQAGESDKLREMCKQLGRENAKFSLEFVGMSQRLSSHELAAIFSKKTIRDLERQNAALRAVLKELA